MFVVITIIPDIPGPDTRHVGARAMRSAEREIRNAIKAGKGKGAYLRSYTLTV